MENETCLLLLQLSLLELGKCRLEKGVENVSEVTQSRGTGTQTF